MLIRIATRKSPLALWQAHHVARQLSDTHPDIQTELVPVSTRGDEILDKSLAKIGGKGLFIKELEVAMLDGEADIAVHSMKDVPAQMPEGMTIASILAREDPGDALVGRNALTFATLPTGAIVGTSSLRRASQLLNARPDLLIRPLRGNVGTRLAKLDSGEFDAVILAAAGLHRLGKQHRITDRLDMRLCLPAAGQGAIGIECRSDALQTLERLAALTDRATHDCVVAERALNAALGSTCTSPVAAYAADKNGIITLRARVAAADGTEILETMATGSAHEAHKLGERAARSLLNLGAKAWLELVNE